MKHRSFIEKCGPRGTETVPCFSCAHCNKIVEVPKPDEPSGFCLCCMYSTCTSPECNKACTPFMKKIEAAESKARFRAAL